MNFNLEGYTAIQTYYWALVHFDKFIPYADEKMFCRHCQLLNPHGFPDSIQQYFKTLFCVS